MKARTGGKRMNAIMRGIRSATPVAVACALGAGLGSAQTLTVTNHLLLRLESGVGVTTNAPDLVSQWSDQAALGGVQDFTSSGSSRPAYVEQATPNGAPAIRFNSTTKRNLTRSADSNFDSASLTWFLALKPTLATDKSNYTYMQSDSATRKFMWGCFYDQYNKRYSGGVRSDANVRYETHVTTNTLAALAQSWMIMAVVYDGAASSVQLFVTDATGGKASGSLVTPAILSSGTHALTRIGANTDNNNPADMDLAAVLLYKTALSPADRAAVETYLYDKYIRLPPSGTVIAVR